MSKCCNKDVTRGFSKEFVKSHEFRELLHSQAAVRSGRRRNIHLWRTLWWSHPLRRRFSSQREKETEKRTERAVIEIVSRKPNFWLSNRALTEDRSRQLEPCSATGVAENPTAERESANAKALAWVGGDVRWKWRNIGWSKQRLKWSVASVCQPA